MKIVQFPFNNLYRAIGWKPYPVELLHKVISSKRVPNPYLFFYHSRNRSFEAIRVVSSRLLIEPKEMIEFKLCSLEINKTLQSVLVVNHISTEVLTANDSDIMTTDLATRLISLSEFTPRDPVQIKQSRFNVFDLKFEDKYDSSIHKICWGIQSLDKTMIIQEKERLTI